VDHVDRPVLAVEADVDGGAQVEGDRQVAREQVAGAGRDGIDRLRASRLPVPAGTIATGMPVPASSSQTARMVPSPPIAITRSAPETAASCAIR